MAKKSSLLPSLPDKVFKKAAFLQSEGKPKAQSIAIAASMDRAGRLNNQGAYNPATVKKGSRGPNKHKSSLL